MADANPYVFGAITGGIVTAIGVGMWSGARSASFKAEILQKAPQVSPNGAAALLRAGETPAVVAITAPVDLPSSGSRRASYLAITTQSRTEGKLLVAEATSKLIGSKIVTKKVTDKSGADGACRTRTETSLVKHTAHDSSETRSVPWGISDGKAVVIPDSTMPSPPLERLGERSWLFDAAKSSSASVPDPDQVGEALLRAARPLDTATTVYTGRVVEFRGLVAGTFLTLVGRAWMDGDGVVRMTAEGGMPSAITRTGVHELINGFRSSSWWLTFAGSVLVAGGGTALAWCGWKAYQAHEDEARGPRAAHVGRGSSGVKPEYGGDVGL